MPLILIDHPWLLPTLAALFGACIGSFINVVAHRLCRILDGDDTISLSYPASRCPVCEAPIRRYDNIPIISWALLRGRCRSCATSIPARYPIVETLGALIGCTAVFAAGWSLDTLFLAAGAWLLLAMAATDHEGMWLPDSLTIPFLWLGLGLAATAMIPIPPTEAIWGAIIGWTALASLNALWRLLRGQEALGGGDFWLLAGAGAWLGVLGLPLVILGGCIGALASAAAGRSAQAAEVLGEGHGTYAPLGTGMAITTCVLILSRAAGFDIVAFFLAP